MQWFIFAGINVVASAVSALFQRLAMKKDDSDPVIASILFQFLLTFFGAIFALLTGFRLPSLTLLPYFFLSGVLYAGGTVALFKSIKRIEASEMSVLAGSGVLFTILISFLFIHERLTSVQFVGALLILCAVVLINYNRKTFRLNTGAWLAILGAACYGTAVVADTYIIKRYDAVSFLPLASFTPGLIISLWYARKIPATIRSLRHIDRNLLIYSFLYAIQGVTFYLALQYGALVSQMSTISRASIILTVLLAMIFLKEKEKVILKVLSAILVTAGVLLIR
jgi:drug/metabolite transporter (DMT)-like permease